MIYLSSEGRLGNQLFQYAFARKLQLKRQDTIIMNFSEEQIDENVVTYGNKIQYLNITPNIKYQYQSKRFLYDNMTAKQKIYYITYKELMKNIKNNYKMTKICQDFFTPMFNKNGLYFQKHNFTNIHTCNLPNILIYGYFQSPKYLDGIEHILKEEFIPKEEPLSKNRQLYTIIENTESVCINIRRGDYLMPKFKKHYICDEAYYKNAIKVMKKLKPDANFIFFSNDISWCKEIFNNQKENYHFESGDDPVWETLRLMYSCKYFIISNSTLAWWAQYLSRYKNKVVISPSRWLDLKNYNSELIENNFIKINEGTL